MSGPTIFGYVEGNPLSGIDPEGLDAWWPNSGWNRGDNRRGSLDNAYLAVRNVFESPTYRDAMNMAGGDRGGFSTLGAAAARNAANACSIAAKTAAAEAKIFSKEATLPESAFSSKAPHQVTPGTRTLEGQYINDQGRVESWNAHYDEYGRLTGRTDFNAGNKAAGIPDTHYHTYEWGPGKSPMETGSHLPGTYAPGGN